MPALRGEEVKALQVTARGDVWPFCIEVLVQGKIPVLIDMNEARHLISSLGSAIKWLEMELAKYGGDRSDKPEGAE